MVLTVRLVCFLLAAICFFLKGLGIATLRVDLMNIGFGFVILGVIFG